MNKKLKYISILALLLTTISLLAVETNAQSSVNVGTFKFQANLSDRSSLFDIIKSVAKSNGYKLMVDSGGLIFDKKNLKYTMMFTIAEGWDCYVLKIGTRNKTYAVEELDTFKNIKKEIMKQLGDSITYIGNEKCPPHS